MKRIISMLLALMLVVGCMAPMAVPASAAEKPEHLTDCGELKLGERVDMDDVCDVYFSFTPAETGVYTFKNYTSSALGCGLYDSQWNWMNATRNDYYDSGFFVTRTLLAGKTYYFWVTAKEGYRDDIRATLKREEISAASGEEYGTNWAYSEDGVLTISGSGGIYDSSSLYGEPHWSNYKYIATKLVIEEGITEIGSEAFRNYETLTSVAIPSTVTSIGEGAFSGCSGLTEVTVPDGVAKVEESTFSGCTGLKTVNLPDTVTGIGEWAFQDCAALTQIDIPDAVTWIGQGAFQNCAALAEIDIPDAVEDIGRGAFKGCSSLKTVVIPEEVSGINSEVFADCTALTSVTLPGGIWNIGDSAFSGCTALTAITLPEKLSSISGSAFSGCTSLAAITLPEELSSIGGGAFSGCTALTEVTIPASVTDMYRDSFDDGVKITIAPGNEVYSIDADGVLYEYDDYQKMTMVMKVPADIQGTYEVSTTVGGIGPGAFLDCTGMTAVVIPENVTRIEESAFQNCTGLTEVVIPAGVTRIEDSAFSGCTSLTSLSIPDGVTMIGNGCVKDCVNLTSLTLGNGILSVNANTFENVGLTEITLPDSVTYIWQEALSIAPI